MNKNDSEPYNSWVKNGLYSLLYKQLPSTNVMAASLMDQGKIAGPTAIITDDQVNGRGQLRTKWHSAANSNLTFTIALPKFKQPVSQQFKVNKAVGLALQQTILPLAGDVKIKWPNDIYFQNKKIAGILVENQISGTQLKSCIIGIGLNVNQTSWPDTIPNPISLKNITQNSYDIQDTQVLWPANFYQLFLQYISKSSSEIDQLFNDALFGLNETLIFRDSEKTFKAQVLGVNTLGQLVLKNESGEELTYSNKEVSFLGKGVKG